MSTVTRESDCLGHWPLAESMIRTFDASPLPTNVLLFGAWGSGKSTFLDVLNQAMEPGGRYHVVRFNPWEYESSSNLLFPLLRAVHNSLPAPIRRKKEVSLIARSCLRAALDIGVRITSSVLSAGTGAVKLKDIESAIENEETLLDDLSDPVEECKNNFRALAGQAIKGGKRALVILLDDLDRCLPETAIALIESVKLYLSTGSGLPVIFVWAMDKDVVSRSLAAKYAVSGVAGRDYLEKIFDYQMPVPSLTAGGSLSLWRRHAGDTDVSPLAELFGEDPIRNISEGLDILPLRNPRTIERLWNVLRTLAANMDEVLQAAGAAGIAEGYRRLKLDQLFFLGIIIGYAEREWRFRTLHNRDDWGLFLRHCDDSTPDAQQFILSHLQLFRILEYGGFASIQSTESKSGALHWRIDLDREHMETLLAVSDILARHGS